VGRKTQQKIMDIFLIPVLRTVILLIGATRVTVYQTHKPRRGKNSVGGSYLLVVNGKSVSFTGSDLTSSTTHNLKTKCSDSNVNVIADLGDFDYNHLTEELRREFKEKLDEK